MKKNAYLAICYNCNENCLFCPCSKKDKSNKMIIEIEKLKKLVDEIDKLHIKDITISGGEPTLHPQFIELIEYIQNKKIHITLLSNSERFSESSFFAAFINNIDITKLKVITTLHSHIAFEHEKANQTRGSFERTIKGLSNLVNSGVKVIIKHCITKKNYRDLSNFYKVYDSFFAEEVDFQLCGIDYCGIPKDQLNQEMLSFVELQPYLENFFDLDIERKNLGSKRKIYCINIPLCACDIYYWDYIPKRRQKMYNSYLDPHRAYVHNSVDNVGIDNIICKECKISSICRGTYFTAFEYFGKEIVKPYK